MSFSVRRYEARTLTWWYSRRDRIDFSPPYQRRGSVWDRETKAFLIDSILNGFDIPKIYLADFSLGKSLLNVHSKLFAVIDGRQRLETLFEFFDDTLKLEATFEYSPDPALSLGGLRYSDLQKRFPDIATDFDNYNIDVMSVFTEDQALINDMFVRLNQNRPLTGAEIRNAMKGVAPKIIRQIAEHEFFHTRIAFSVARGQDRNSAAKLLMTEFRGGLFSTQRNVLDTFVITAAKADDTFVTAAVQAESTDLQSAANRVISTLDNLNKIFKPRDSMLKTEGNLVVYFWLVRNYAKRFDIKTLRRTMGILSTQPNDYNSIYHKRDEEVVSDPPDLSNDRVLYRNHMRSVNHSASLAGRYRLLEKWLLRPDSGSESKLPKT